MELSRRDALTALGAAGIAATAGCSSLLGDEGSAGEGTVADETDATGGETDATDDETDVATETPADPSAMDTMLALGEVLYPSQVEVTESFVQTYLLGRIYDEEAYQAELEQGVETLDGIADDEYGQPFATLSADQRVALVENTDLRTGESVQDGSDVQRVNYHLIDELLFAFYSSDTGGELVGNRNPRGFPGGFGYSQPVEQ